MPRGINAVLTAGHVFVRRVGVFLPDGIGWSLAIFALVNVLGDVIQPHFDANAVWMPMPLAPGDMWRQKALMAIFGLCMLISLVRRPGSWGLGIFYVVAQAVTLFLIANALTAAISFYRALSAGQIQARWPLPFAALTLVALATQIWRVHRSTFRRETMRVSAPSRIVATAMGMFLLYFVFILGQFFLVGGITRLARADAIVVLGAGLTPYGGPTMPLSDRVRKGVELYDQGWAPTVVFTGGPGRIIGSEVEVMSGLATAAGVPRADQALDDQGYNTFCTVLNIRRMMRERGWNSIIVVTHDYHLPRTILAFQRAGIKSVFPAPSPRLQVRPKDVRYLLREAMAWPYYYLRPCWQPLLPESNPLARSPKP